MTVRHAWAERILCYSHQEFIGHIQSLQRKQRDYGWYRLTKLYVILVKP